jgi:two-component system, OmpR family, alkaline phosphatase synthesis response regulator PhoP
VAPRVLVADHEPEVAEMVRQYLERASLSVTVAASPGAAVRALAGRACDVFVIDLMMPGLEVRALRRALTSAVPVVFLLERQTARPHGLNSPSVARRWLIRPFSPRALVEAVTELLRAAPGEPGGRSEQTPPAAAAPDAAAERDIRQVIVAGRPVTLTRTEHCLLAALAAQPGRVLTRQCLIAALESDRGKAPSPRAVDVYVSQLRVKLGPDTIRTIRGVGYILDTSALGNILDTSALGNAEVLQRQTPGGVPGARSAGV